MNYFPSPRHSIVLSSHRPGAPYEDRLEENGTVLIYEGHDEPRSSVCPQPKTVDQPLQSRLGRLTQNGLFNEAAQAFVREKSKAVEVRVYEKLKDGIWSYNGRFALVDSWTETLRGRRVFKFKLMAMLDAEDAWSPSALWVGSEQRRIIPAAIKLEVWKRDRGACVTCGATTELHFDHILAYSKGGTSELAANIQLLCARHNLSKGARIQ
jgi:hypothetical protein